MKAQGGKSGIVLAIRAPKGAPAAGGPQDTEGLDSPESGSGEDCVPLAALAMPDSESGDQMTNPEVGDKVNYQIQGTVTRIEGENAYVKRESVNGQPVDEESGEEEPSPEDQANQADQSERQDLSGMADKMGGMS